MAELVRPQEQKVPLVKNLLLRAQAALSFLPGINSQEVIQAQQTVTPITEAAVVTHPQVVSPSTEPRINYRQDHVNRTMRLQATHMAEHWGVQLTDKVIAEYVEQRQTNRFDSDQALLTQILQSNNIQILAK